MDIHIYIYVDMEILLTSGCIGVFRVSVINRNANSLGGPASKSLDSRSWVLLSGNVRDILCVLDNETTYSSVVLKNSNLLFHSYQGWWTGLDWFVPNGIGFKLKPTKPRLSSRIQPLSGSQSHAVTPLKSVQRNPRKFHGSWRNNLFMPVCSEMAWKWWYLVNHFKRTPYQWYQPPKAGLKWSAFPCHHAQGTDGAHDCTAWRWISGARWAIKSDNGRPSRDTIYIYIYI